MEFDTRRRFGCHGVIEIFVEPAHPAFLTSLSEHFHSRRPITVTTCFSRQSGEPGTRLIEKLVSSPPDTFTQEISPPLQLLMVGEGPDSKALRVFADTLGWRTVAVESATEINGWYDEWTAAVVKTHNYGRDFAALRALLPCGLRYIGLLGSRKRREQLLGDLLDTGIEVGDHLFGPAGLDLGGDTPESIALAIVAEIQAVFAGGSRQSLRDRRAPVHAPRDLDSLAVAS
jgi:xanthine/CO dehydrogenase XdhC/CoxF family maturation factor